MLFVVLAVFLLSIGGAVLYQLIGERLDARRLPPPGRLIQAANGRLHLHEKGNGEPSVVLEAGIAGTSVGWALVQPEIASFTRVCSYDRAGLGWSDQSRMPRSVEQMTAELSKLLKLAGIAPPYILVGHSFGGLLVRAFAHASPALVAGMLLVDPVCVEHWSNCTAAERRRLELGVRFSRRGAFLARLGVVRGTLALLAAGGRRLPKLIARTSAGVATGTLQRLVGEIRKLPAEVQPMVRAQWSAPKSFNSMADYLSCLPESARLASKFQVAASIPCTILSAGTATAQELAERDCWISNSARGKHLQVAGTGHWIQLERPDLVISAVRELVELTRTT